MNPICPDVGYYPHSKDFRWIPVAPVLYSAGIQHLGLIRPWTTESGGSGGLGLTVWIMRARQWMGIRTAPRPSCAEVSCWGTHFGGASHLLAHEGLATPPGSSTPELPRGRARNEPPWS
jgi:hypothetical protein